MFQRLVAFGLCRAGRECVLMKDVDVLYHDSLLRRMLVGSGYGSCKASFLARTNTRPLCLKRELLWFGVSRTLRLRVYRDQVLQP